MDEVSLRSRAYSELYSRCLHPTQLDLAQWRDLPQWRRPFRLTGIGVWQEFLLADSIPELSKVPVNQRGALICGAVYATFLKDSQDYECFLAECKKSIHLWKRRPKKNWSVWVHLDINSPPDWLLVGRVLGRAYEIRSLSAITARIPRETLDAFTADNKVNLRDCRWLFQMETLSGDEDEAFEACVACSELVRSILNWATHARTVRYMGPSKEACTHYPPLLYACRAEADEPKLFRGYGVTKTGNRKIEPYHEEMIREWMTYFRPTPKKGTMKSFLGEALRLANEGLDSIYPHQQFLAIWTALEKLMFVQSGSPSEVAKRVPRLWQNGHDSDIALAMPQLACIRNRLVHEGEFEHDDDAALIWLRTVFVTVVRRLMEISKRASAVESIQEILSGQNRTLTSVRARIVGLQELEHILTTE